MSVRKGTLTTAGRQSVPLFAAAALPIAALAGGLALNATLVSGDYEYFGLARIAAELLGRTGFWCIAIFVWLMGHLQILPARSHWRHRPRLAALAAAAASVVLLQFAGILAMPVGSAVDLLCLALLAGGVLVYGIADDSRPVAIARAGVMVGLTIMAVFLAYSAVAYFHTMAKGSLFIVATATDESLWKLDEWLVGSGHYQRVADWRVGHPGLVRLLDIAYVGLLQQVAWSALFFYANRDHAAGLRYLLSMFMIYVVGPAAYFLAPSWGPVFHAPALFADLAQAAPDTWHLVQFLRESTESTVLGTAHEIAPFGFVAAMPSLHVGIGVIMLLAMRHSRPMLVFNSALLALTLLATNVLGWHYVGDLIVGAVLGLVVWALSGWLAGPAFGLRRNPLRATGAGETFAAPEGQERE